MLEDTLEEFSNLESRRSQLRGECIVFLKEHKKEVEDRKVKEYLHTDPYCIYDEELITEVRRIMSLG